MQFKYIYTDHIASKEPGGKYTVHVELAVMVHFCPRNFRSGGENSCEALEVQFRLLDMEAQSKYLKTDFVFLKAVALARGKMPDSRTKKQGWDGNTTSAILPIWMPPSAPPWMPPS